MRSDGPEFDSWWEAYVVIGAGYFVIFLVVYVLFSISDYYLHSVIKHELFEATKKVLTGEQQ